MPLFFDDLAVGQQFETVGRTVTDHDVMAFAGLSGDFNQIHTNDEFARTTAFGERIAHGILVLAIASGLTHRLGLFDGTTKALLSLEWQFKAPVRLKDTVRVRMTIESMRPASKGDAGIVRRRCEVLNQRDETVQEGVFTALVRMRPREQGAAP